MDEKTTNQPNEQEEIKSMEDDATKEKFEELKDEVEENLDDDKLVVALSYIGILFLIPLFLKRESKFAQFNAKQGLVIFLGEILASFLLPLLGIGALLWVAAVIFSIMGIINVFNGKMDKLPLIGDLADKFNI